MNATTLTLCRILRFALKGLVGGSYMVKLVWNGRWLESITEQSSVGQH